MDRPSPKQQLCYVAGALSDLIDRTPRRFHGVAVRCATRRLAEEIDRFLEGEPNFLERDDTPGEYPRLF
jgi:hypothetical protein